MCFPDIAAATERRINMKKTAILTALAAITILASCAEVPEDVISRAENESVTDSLESKPESRPESPLVFDTVENVTGNAASVLGKKYQNIVLPESIDIPVTDEAYIMTAGRFVPEADIKSGKVDVAKDLEDFALMFAGEKPEHVRSCGTAIPEVDEYFIKRTGSDYKIDPESYKKQKQYFSPEQALESDGIGKYNIEFYGSGSISAAKYTDDWNFRHTGDDAAFVYDLEKDDITGISYSVAGQDYPLTEAVSFAESFVREKLMPFLRNDDRVRALKIYVFEGFGDEAYGLTPGNYYYYILFEHYTGGLPLSTAGAGQQRKDHLVNTELVIGIDIPGEVTEVKNCYPYVSKKRPAEKLLTLESALAHAEYVLAPFEVYKAKKITLEYCAVEAGTSQPLTETVYEYHPTWCLTLAESSQHKRWRLESRKLLCIDAVDGTVRLWDDSQATILFEEKKEV